ncbi:hypothetical protein BDV18DRAFT_155931 [Aspergillus unguis]
MVTHQPAGSRWTAEEEEMLRKCREQKPPMSYHRIQTLYIPNRSTHTIQSKWSRLKNPDSSKAQLRPKMTAASRAKAGHAVKNSKTAEAIDQEMKDADAESSSESESDDETISDNDHAAEDETESAEDDEEPQEQANRHSSVTSAEPPSQISSSSEETKDDSSTEHKVPMLNHLARAAEAMELGNTPATDKKVSNNPLYQSRGQYFHHQSTSFGTYNAMQDTVQKVLSTWTPERQIASSLFRAAVAPPSPPSYSPYFATSPEHSQRFRAINSGMYNTGSFEAEQQLESVANRLLQGWNTPREDRSGNENLTVPPQQAVHPYERPPAQPSRSTATTAQHDSDSYPFSDPIEFSISDEDEKANSGNGVPRSPLRPATDDDREHLIAELKDKIEASDLFVDYQNPRIERLESELDRRTADLRHFQDLFAAVADLINKGVKGDKIKGAGRK